MAETTTATPAPVVGELTQTLDQARVDAARRNAEFTSQQQTRLERAVNKMGEDAFVAVISEKVFGITPEMTNDQASEAMGKRVEEAMARAEQGKATLKDKLVIQGLDAIGEAIGKSMAGALFGVKG